jgi:hypothetical protein
VDQSVTKNKENKISGPIGSLQAGDKWGSVESWEEKIRPF